MRESYHETWSAVDHTYIIRSLIWNWHLGIWLRDERKLSWDVIGSRSHIHYQIFDLELAPRYLVERWEKVIMRRDRQSITHYYQIFDLELAPRYLVERWEKVIMRRDRQSITHIIRSLIWNWHLGIWLRDERKLSWDVIGSRSHIHYQIFDLELAPRYLVERWEKVIMRRDRQSITHYLSDLWSGTGT